MADETERFRDLVARQIGEQLRQGNLNGLIQAQRAVEATFTLSVTPSLSFDSGLPPGAGAFTLQAHPRLEMGGEPPRVDAAVGGEGTLSVDAAVVVTPEVRAEGRLVPQEVVDAIRAALPQLANDMQASSPQTAILLLTAFMALMALLTAAMQAYQLFNPQTPTPTEIFEIFNQTYSVVNPTPPHGAG